jgi:tetratricopeptide (TPR) repeat protein
MNQEDRLFERRKRLESAQGYLMLDMDRDAAAELKGLGERHLPEALERALLAALRLELAVRGRHWRNGVACAARLRRHAPENPGGFIHGAYCLHELGRTREALAMLMAGPAALRGLPMFFYNLGCYHAVLGEHLQALACLNEAFQRDPALITTARTDPDLRGLQFQA